MLVGLLPVLGCTASHAPPRWLPDADAARRDGYGAWAEFSTGADSAAALVAGELLAISDDSVYTLRGSQVSVLALAGVIGGRIEFYDPGTRALTRATLAGTVSTITHGIFLVVSAPLWVVTGSATTAAVSRDGKLALDPSRPPGRAAAAAGATRSRRASWRDLRLHARFPQGWPAGLDRRSLHERPLREPARRTPEQHGITRY